VGEPIAEVNVEHLRKLGLATKIDSSHPARYGGK